MATVRIRWSAEAVRDLEEIHAYIARDSPRYAAVVTDRLIAALELVQVYPQAGRMVPELGDSTVREVIHGAYRIIYEVRGEDVEVLTVFRGSRQFPPLGR